jgi:hypothetical protein
MTRAHNGLVVKRFASKTSIVLNYSKQLDEAKTKLQIDFANCNSIKASENKEFAC